MNSVFNPKRFWVILWVLGAVVIAKVSWVAAEWLIHLPVQGIEYENSSLLHALHYRYRLASDTKLNVPKKKDHIKTPPPRASLSSYKLVGIYSKGSYAVVTLVKGSKSFVLATGPKGGELEGYHLKEANATAAVFKKGDETTVLKLYEKKTPSQSGGESIKRAITVSKSMTEKKGEKEEPKIVDEGDVKKIDRSLIREYTENPDKIWKNIGLYEVKENDRLAGFKVRFVRRGSPFEKLGLRRGDIIKAINGEPIVDYATPMRMLRSADTIDDLSLTVERNHEEQELKYEVK